MSSARALPWIAAGLCGALVAIVWATSSPPAIEAPIDPDAGASLPDAPPPRALGTLPSRPNLVLVSIDTLRADHLSTYGYERETSPAIDRVAEHGVVFTSAYANASWTLPSVASMLTSVLPSEHGALIETWDLDEGVVSYGALPSALPSLASTLAAAGYRTLAVVGNVWLRPSHGFARGFDVYRYLGNAALGEIEPVLGEIVPGAIDDERPFFLWVHIIEPHAPYAPPAAEHALFWPGAARPELDALRGPEAIGTVLGYPPTVVDLAYLRAAYDGEIRVATDFVERFLATVSAEPYVALVVSDHGEEFGDHGGMGHGHTVFEEAVHVPFVIVSPGLAHAELDTPVALLDVLPTLAELAGATPAGGARGRSLVPLLRGETLAPVDVVFETGPSDATVRGILRDGIKYGYLVREPPIERMYDLRTDPGEVEDLSRDRPALARTLRAELDRVATEAAARRPAVTVPAPVLTDGETEGLRELGYVP